LYGIDVTSCEGRSKEAVEAQVTQDEFERIVTAAVQMRTWNINGEIMVSLKGLVAIVESQLHPEDKGKYIWFDDGTRYGWKRQGEA
jgi:hypothetical protein